MIVNQLVNLFFIFAGIFDVVGKLGGVLFLAAIVWLFGTRRGAALRAGLRLGDEYRCRQCDSSDYCMSAYSGIEYPCPYYKKKGDKR